MACWHRLDKPEENKAITCEFHVNSSHIYGDKACLNNKSSLVAKSTRDDEFSQIASLGSM